MIRRVTAGEAKVKPWSAPFLDPDERRGAAPAREQQPLPEAAPPPDAAALAESALAALRAEKAAEGHAEGLARGLEEGRQRGYADGLAVGRVEAQQHLDEASHRLASVLDALSGPIAALDGPLEDAVVSLALELARRVIGAEASQSHAAMVELIRKVLAEIPIDIGRPRVLLHPEDLDLVRKRMPEVGKGKIELVGDESIEPGGCRVLADDIDATTRPDRRWSDRGSLFEGNLTLAARWRAAMLALFE